MVLIDGQFWSSTATDLRQSDCINDRTILNQKSNFPFHGNHLGSGDIQSLAELNSSYEIVSDMRAVPFGLGDIARLAAATAAS